MGLEYEIVTISFVLCHEICSLSVALCTRQHPRYIGWDEYEGNGANDVKVVKCKSHVYEAQLKELSNIPVRLD